MLTVTATPVIAFGAFVLVMTANALFDMRRGEASITLILSLAVVAVDGLVIIRAPAARTTTT